MTNEKDVSEELEHLKNTRDNLDRILKDLEYQIQTIHSINIRVRSLEKKLEIRQTAVIENERMYV